MIFQETPEPVKMIIRVGQWNSPNRGGERPRSGMRPSSRLLCMAKRRVRTKSKQVDDYRHDEATRANNPPAGLVWHDTDEPSKLYVDYDPHLDPQLILDRQSTSYFA